LQQLQRLALERVLDVQKSQLLIHRKGAVDLREHRGAPPRELLARRS
jgi:hypothetical protein